MDRSCRLLHGQPRQPYQWNYFPLLTGRIVLSNKKRNLRKYSVVLVAFSKKKSYLGPRTFQSKFYYPATLMSWNGPYWVWLYFVISLETFFLFSNEIKDFVEFFSAAENFIKMAYNQTSAQREHNENVCVFVRDMCITQRKIFSNIFKCNLIFTSVNK